ncbi:MAG TPA: O-antigen ligase family protein [Anaerolineae bacterium]|nr:O-antigen ligase family protein [Anaerolineae bacterium]HQK12611.1 O-antigen ligase family protein [Anaerolineae bacterium]
MINWRTTVQDLLESSPLRPLFFSRRRWLLVAMAVLLAAALSIGGGWLIAELGALPVIVLLVAMGLFVWILRDIEIAYAGVIGVITLLPFASLPFSIGFKPTFLDLALGGLFLVWLLPYLLGEEQRFDATPLGALVLVFAFLAIGTFVAGLGHAALTVTLIRRFAETLLSIALFYLVVNTVRDVGRLGRLMRWLILGATAAAALGIILYFLPDLLTVRILSALGRLGYPTGVGVLRYIRDDPSLMQRATSTSVDPNVLGSLLNLALVMTVPQLFARRPLLPRWVLITCLGLLGVCLGLTISRGSMAAAVLAVLAISVLRYRKLLPWFAVALLLVLILPWTQGYIRHFVEGIQLQDLSMKMRLGEYKDAFILIRRYPLLGVGFAGAPDIDIYTAVASVYLTIAERMGLIGLVVFLAIAGVLLARFWRWRKVAETLPDLEPLWYGIHAAIIAGLIAGVSDHYFFSLDFHHSVTLFWLIVGLATASVQIARSSMLNDS